MEKKTKQTTLLQILSLIPIIIASITLGEFVVQKIHNFEIDILREAEREYLYNNIDESIRLYQKLDYNEVALNNLGVVDFSLCPRTAH